MRYGVYYQLIGTDAYTIFDVKVSGCGGDGFRISDQSYRCSLISCGSLLNGGNGITFYDRINNGHIIGGFTRQNTGHGLYIYNSGGVTVDGLNSQTNGGNGVYIYGSATGESSGCVLNGLWLEANVGSNIKVNTGAGQIKGMQIQGGLSTGSTGGYGIELQNIVKCSVIGMHIDEPANALGGILLDTNTLQCTVIGNRVIGTVINNGLGNYVRKSEGVNKTFFIPVPNPDTVVGRHAVSTLTDGVTTEINLEAFIPDDWYNGVTAYAIVIQTATVGAPNINYRVRTDFGTDGEVYNVNTDTSGTLTTAVTQNQITFLTCTAAFQPDYRPNDVVGILFERYGGAVDDTINADAYLIGIIIYYN